MADIYDSMSSLTVHDHTLARFLNAKGAADLAGIMSKDEKLRKFFFGLDVDLPCDETLHLIRGIWTRRYRLECMEGGHARDIFMTDALGMLFIGLDSARDDFPPLQKYQENTMYTVESQQLHTIPIPLEYENTCQPR